MPCGPCCSCELQSDGFTSLSRWAIDSGSWSIVGNALLGSGAGEIVFDYDPPGSDPVRVRVNPSAGVGECYRVILGRADADNYVFAEVLVESSSGAKDGYFAIGSREAGAETIEHWNFHPGDLTGQQITVCYRDDLTPCRLVAYFGTNGASGTVRNFMREVPATGGRKAGLGVVSGTVVFDDWLLDCTTVNPLDCGKQGANAIGFQGSILSGSDNVDAAVIGDLRIYHTIHNRGASYYTGFGQFGLAVFFPSFSWKFGKRAYLCFRLLDDENYCFVRFTFIQSATVNGFLSVDIGHVEGGAETILQSASGPSIALSSYTDTTPTYSICVEGDDIEVQISDYAPGGDFSLSTALPTIDGDSWHFARGVGSLLDSPGEITVEYSVAGIDESTPWDSSCIVCP